MTLYFQLDEAQFRAADFNAWPRSARFVMVRKDDLSSLSEAQLLQAYVENVQAWEVTEHVGAANRLMDRRMRIVDELKARSGGTLESMRVLLDHADPKVRHSAAIKFRTIDHAAFERTVRALAQRDDEIGRDAKSSLDLDAHFQKVGYPEHQKEAPHAPAPFAWKVHWQADNPPPKAMTHAAIQQVLFDAFPAAIADQLLRLALPAIGLWPQRPRADLPIGVSRLGGVPHAPSGWSWPLVETEPMLFLGQINCADLQGLPGADKLPSSGALAFFGDHDAVMACDFAARDIAVTHWPDIDRLAPASPPIEVTRAFPLCELVFRALIDLPDPSSRVVGNILTDREQRSRYQALRNVVRGHGIAEDLYSYCGFSKLFGWPSLVQQCDLEETGDSSDANGFRLLLQLDKYSNGTDSEGWGPGGSLYFLIRDQDLRKRQFDRCAFEIQFT